MSRACVLLFLLLQALRAGQPPFRLFTTEDGLVRNWIERIRSDSRGYLWFCTVEGISMFDGSRFTNFTVRDGLPNRLVYDLIEVSTGDYWIATDNGVSRFGATAGPRGHFENFHVSTQTGANHVRTILEDSQHRVWLATEGGLFRSHSPVAMSGVATSGAMAFDYIPLGPSPPPVLSALVEDGSNRIWAGGAYGVDVVSPSGAAEHLGLSRGVPVEVKALLLDGGKHRNKLWVGGVGLVAFDTASAHLSVIESYTTANGKPLGIISLHQKPGEDDLWVGSFGATPASGPTCRAARSISRRTPPHRCWP